MAPNAGLPHLSVSATLAVVIALHAITTAAQQFADSTFDVSYPGISDGCESALNSTVQCPSILGSVSITSDYLTPDQLSTLCVDTCSRSLSTVRRSIQQACSASTDVIVNGGIAYPATYVIDHFIYTFNSSCRKDSSTGEFCDTLLQSWANESSLTEAQNCSDCMLGIAQIELDSPLGYTNESAQDFASTTLSCAATGYSVTVPAQYALNGTSSATSSASAAPTTSCAAHYSVRDGDDCNSIAVAQNVSTFGLTYANNLDAYCSDLPAGGTSLCLPDPCDIYTLQNNQTCLDVIRAQSSDITVTQLQTWNLNINSLCGNLERLNGTVICVSPPGGFLDYNSGANLSVSTAITPVPAPTNVDPGTTSRCGIFYTVQAGDYCSLVTVRFGISLSDFYFLNPSIDANCTNLILGEAYCVQAVGSITTYANYTGAGATAGPCDGASAPASCFGDASTLSDTPLIAGNATTTSGSGTASAVSPTIAPQTSLPHAPNTIDGCYKYQAYREENVTASEGVSVNNCTGIALLNYVTVADLVAWNPSLDQGAKCALQPGFSYCVQKTSASGMDNSTYDTFGTCDPVSSTMAGTDSSCSCYADIYGWDADDYTCEDLAADYDLTVAKLTSLNSWINNSNCTQGLYADLDTNDMRAVCIGTGPQSTQGPTSTSVSPSTTSVTSIGPTQTGITANCQQYYTVSSGDSCSAIDDQFGITFDQLYSWNPAIGDNCQNLWVGYSICVKGPSTATTPASTTSSSSPIGPTQTGITSKCTTYYTVQSGDSCAAIDSEYGITFQEFYAWNPAVGSNCENLWVGYAYCVAGPDVAPTSATTTSASAAPTQTGITSSCAQYYTVKSGDSCAAIDDEYGLTFQQFYAWNPAVGDNCQNLWVGYGYCVAASA